MKVLDDLCVETAAECSRSVPECERLESDLAHANARLDGIIKSAMDGIVSMDAQQRILVFNPAAEQMFGLPANRMIGQPIDRLMPERFRAAHGQQVVNFGETGKTSRRMGMLRTIIGLRANGEEFPIEASISQIEVLREADGKIWKEKLFTAILRDVTGRLRLEQELGTTNQELLKRTRDLEESVAELKVFTYSLSHDMRAPLRSMKAFSNILLEETSDKLNAKEKDYLQRISKSSGRMDQLINDVMIYKEISEMPVSAEIVDLEQLIRDLTLEHPRLIAAGGIKMETPLRTVVAHEGLLARCVSNLLVNAVKFVAAGVAPQVKIWTEPRKANVRVWIEDNGIGIDLRFHERIFEFFERLDVSGPDEGTGIGLALVKKGITRMGGKVGVESAVGKGSRFWFELPGGSA